MKTKVVVDKSETRQRSEELILALSRLRIQSRPNEGERSSRQVRVSEVSHMTIGILTGAGGIARRKDSTLTLPPSHPLHKMELLLLSTVPQLKLLACHQRLRVLLPSDRRDSTQVSLKVYRQGFG